MLTLFRCVIADLRHKGSTMAAHAVERALERVELSLAPERLARDKEARAYTLRRCPVCDAERGERCSPSENKLEFWETDGRGNGSHVARLRTHLALVPTIRVEKG